MLEEQDLDREDQLMTVVVVVVGAGENVAEGEPVEVSVTCAKGVERGPVDLLWTQRVM